MKAPLGFATPPLALVTAALALGLATPSLAQTSIVIVNADDPGEGFNDPTPVSPVGGNTATTLGAQRLQVFQAAASRWEAQLASDVTIQVQARFDPLPCSAFSGTLGSAGPTTVFRDFPGAVESGTWYPQALANSLAGFDLSSSPDLSATFNGDIDNNDDCLVGTNWYLGLDGAGGGIDLLSVVVHELGHGLGFLTFVDPETGARLLGRDDVFMRRLQDEDLGLTWDQLSDAERAASATDNGDLTWIGSEVVAASGALTTGAEPSGAVRMYAPSTLAPGSSVSHWDTVLSPNELMEPFINSPPVQDIGLAVELMRDIGWEVPEVCVGDLDGDGVTGGGDFTIFAPQFGTRVPPGTGADLDGDGLVGSNDFIILGNDFGCGL